MRKRPHRLMARFSAAEREIVATKAKDSGQTLHEYIRFTLLGAGLIATADPVKRKLLQDANRELGRQGNNLNQIAHQLNAGTINPSQGDSMLSLLARSLLDAHRSVRQALAEGRVPE